MNEVIQIQREDLEKYISQTDCCIVDIREKWEFHDFNLGGINVPAHELNENLDELKTYKSLVIVCSNGTRSNILARVIAKKLPETIIYHLEEGIF